MDELSRRKLLKAGGAIGAMGVVGAVTGIRPAWAWSSAQSVVGGTLDTQPPDTVWDPEADAVVHRLFRDEGITRISELNALLRPWRKNGQALPSGLPADLKAFIEEARKPPTWLDKAKLAQSFEFTKKR